MHSGVPYVQDLIVVPCTEYRTCKHASIALPSKETQTAQTSTIRRTPTLENRCLDPRQGSFGAFSNGTFSSSMGRQERMAKAAAGRKRSSPQLVAKHLWPQGMSSCLSASQHSTPRPSPTLQWTSTSSLIEHHKTRLPPATAVF